MSPEPSASVMGFMMKLAKNTEIIMSGPTLQRFSTTYQLQLLLREAYSVFMEDFHLELPQSIKWGQFKGIFKSPGYGKVMTESDFVERLDKEPTLSLYLLDGPFIR